MRVVGGLGCEGGEEVCVEEFAGWKWWFCFLCRRREVRGRGWVCGCGDGGADASSRLDGFARPLLFRTIVI